MFNFFSGAMQSVLAFFYAVTVRIGIPNYGLAIILLTVVIKVALYPLTRKQIKSMKAMQELGPQLKAVQTKYANDKAQQQLAVAELYKKAGVNPLAGCLPLLIQMPFLTGIFYAIRNFAYASQPSFLWIKNLAVADPLYILPVLAAATTYFSTRQTMTDNSQQNKTMTMVMPLFIGYMTVHFPAGLGLYWVASNIVQIGQQWLLYRGKPVAC